MSECVRLKVRVIPNSSREGCVGWYGDAYKVKLQAPPESGKANKALLRILAVQLDVAVKDIAILKGETAQDKLLEIVGLNNDELVFRLNLDRN